MELPRIGNQSRRLERVPMNWRYPLQQSAAVTQKVIDAFNPAEGSPVVHIGRGKVQWWLEDIQDEVAFLSNPWTYGYQEVLLNRLRLRSNPAPTAL
jgi:hypothetical protein